MAAINAAVAYTLVQLCVRARYTVLKNSINANVNFDFSTYLVGFVTQFYFHGGIVSFLQNLCIAVGSHLTFASYLIGRSSQLD